MQRRKFILDALRALPILFISPSVLASSRVLNSDKTVVVIGAGIAGLTAAKTLKNNGFKVLVLESQAKIGGRIRTNRQLGFAFEEGASWIHGPANNPVTNIARQAGATTYLTDDDLSEVFDHKGKPYPDHYLDEEYDLFEKAAQAVKRAGKLNQSFEATLNALYPQKAQTKLWKYMLSAYLEFDHGADVANLSSLYFDDDELFSGKDVIITNGYDKVTDFLAQGLDVRLNTRVTQLNYAGKKTTVTAGNQTFEADYVVVCVPLGVLNAKTISFTPALPVPKQQAIQNTKMGTLNKFLLSWKTPPFWDTSQQYIGYTPETKGKFNYFINLNKFIPNANSLLTFAFGNYATATEAMSDAEVTQQIMAHLKVLYGKNIPNPSSMLRTQWGKNINTFGAYSYATNGTTSTDFDTMAQEIDNKLFFAGEHTNANYRGTVHGAYLSGLREAKKIMKLR